MRICLVGGIFGASPEHHRSVTTTPETVLRDGLRSRGHLVECRSHYGPFDYEGFEVVHVHHLSHAALVAAAERSGARLVFTPHAGVRLSRVRQRAMGYVATRADAVIALSQTEVAWQRKHFGVRQDRQRLIPNGIDHRIFRYSPPRRADDGPWRLLYVGQLIAEKRVDHLLEAIAALRPRVHVELDLVYHVADEEDALATRARQLGLHGVRFHGAKTPVELSAFYRACHVLVLPSMFAEALPSVISEALLTGRPVVATRVGACEEQVAGFGRIVSPGSVTELTKAIAEVLDEYQTLARGAELASRSANSRFSIDVMLDRHQALYDELIKRSSPAMVRRRPSTIGLAGRLTARRARPRPRAR